MAKQKYWNGTSWEVIGTDASKVKILDSAAKFAATDVEAALLELFTFANNGKTSIAGAVNAKGVAATAADTFPTLATKIGQISTGKKVARGSVASNGPLVAFTYLDGQNTTNAFKLTVAGLDFLPSLIYVNDLYNGYSAITLYSTEPGELGPKSIKCTGGNFGTSTGVGNTWQFKGDVLPASVVYGGFTLPVMADGPYQWVAFE